MASCNTNGLLKYYADVILNGDNLISLTQPHNSFDNNDSTERKYTNIMAPRTDPSFVSMPVQVNGTSDAIKNDSTMGNEAEQSVSSEQVSSDKSQSCLATDDETLIPSSQSDHISTKLQNQTVCDKLIDYERTLQNHSLLTQRLSVCSQRLFHNRTRALSLLTRLLACNSSVSQDELLSSDSLPSIISPNLTYEDTESSTDDEAEMKKALSSSKQSWLYTRSVTHSNWHWLCTEIKHAEKCLQNLYMLKNNSDQEKLSQYQSNSNNIENDAEVSCSRTSPYINTKRKRHTYHNLSSPKCASVIQELRKHSLSDPHIKCSCIPPFIGPCILCCGSEPSTSHTELANKSDERDLLMSAHSLCSHIHPKLSIPGDVQLGLRLESRLAAYSSVHFRPHKATVHRVQPWDKPNCLQPLEPINRHTPNTSKLSTQSNQPTVKPPKCPPSQTRNSHLRKRRLLSSKNSRTYPISSAHSVTLPPKNPRSVQNSNNNTNNNNKTEEQ
ncbi:unnamed protein product [Schistosoma curassoni]|uniref:PEHE domain-containing protein n=1 Tax=Schistosoma curassoni TaxID=6186 RepID=A0A183K0S8_9TREM|nr:unnamed protein product [Schistosoma curassoni]VDP31564.1 unnamed protein product [Schistosoma curassoni]